MQKAFAACVLAITLAAPVLAQVPRLLPANGKLGHLAGQQQYPLVQIDRKTLRLAPGGVIVDQNNRFIVHGALPAEAEVLYVLDNRGDISRIVMLTPSELTRLQAAQQR
ncbi:MAG TPA: hypothetical protein VFZ14_13290 [Burkholderiales bacterium]|nr:hypothetical protein [Burkholderiales bacterium]